MISLRGLAKIGVVLCCGIGHASPMGDAIGPYVDGGELPGAVSVVVDTKGRRPSTAASARATCGPMRSVAFFIRGMNACES